MVSFLIALFLLCFLVIKWCDKKHEREIDKQKQTMTISRIGHLQESYSDGDLEIVVSEALRSPKYDSNIQQELRETFRKIPGCRDFRMDHKLYRRPNAASNVTCHKMALRILMANRGKMLKEEAGGMAYGVKYSPIVGLPSQISEVDRYRRNMFKRILIWMEEEYNRKGIPAKLYVEYVPAGNGGNGIILPAREYEDPTSKGRLTDEIYCYHWGY